MANTEWMDFKVTGLDELARNLAEFGSPKMLGKIVGMSLRAGAALPLSRAKVNARALGLGFIGFRPRRNDSGSSMGQSRRYGRIPLSLRAGKAYIPKGSGVTNAYRLNVGAAGQRQRGIFRNKAPHAHLVEYGYRHLGSGRSIAARPYLGPALDSTAPQVIDLTARRMQGLIDLLKFPTTGRGP